jgi:translation initiation factor 2B subunit (eIF-2B alpha/beta/delta family)
MAKYNKKFKDLFNQPAYIARQEDLRSITDELDQLGKDTDKLNDLEDIMIKDSLFFLNYVTDNNSKISVENDEVIIDDETVLTQYNSLLDKMVASAENFLKVQDSIVNEYSTAFDEVSTY